jgi:hypothetical protein
MEAWIMAISFIVLGIVLFIFAPRIGQWWQRVGGSLMLRITPWRKSPSKDIDRLMDEWAKSRWRIYDIVCGWLTRIMGIMLALAGALLLYVLISQS